MIYIWYLAGLKSDSDVLVGVLYTSLLLCQVSWYYKPIICLIFFFPCLTIFDKPQKRKGRERLQWRTVKLVTAALSVAQL